MLSSDTRQGVKKFDETFIELMMPLITKPGGDIHQKVNYISTGNFSSKYHGLLY
jgi:hypothetical protein